MIVSHTIIIAPHLALRYKFQIWTEFQRKQPSFNRHIVRRQFAALPVPA